MAIEKTIESADGREIEGCYWTPVQINIGALDEAGQITFYGHSSREARAQRKPGVAGAIRQYPFNAEQFNAATELTMGELLGEGVINDETTLYEVLATFAYSTAKQRQDVPVLDSEGQPVLSEDGTPKMRSFFEDGADV